MSSPAASPSHPTAPSSSQNGPSAQLLTSFAVSEADGKSSLFLNDLLVLADDSCALDKLGGDYLDDTWLSTMRAFEVLSLSATYRKMVRRSLTQGPRPFKLSRVLGAGEDK